MLKTSKSVENALRDIRFWLVKLGVSNLDIDVRYDAGINVALLRFKYDGKSYEFRSAKQQRVRLNVHAIARAIEAKVRLHIMGIELFAKSMSPYLLLESDVKSGSEMENDVDEMNYIVLGLTSLASNEDIKKCYVRLMKTYHPDMALSEEAKLEFQKRCAEINNAYGMICKVRGI